MKLPHVLQRAKIPMLFLIGGVQLVIVVAISVTAVSLLAKDAPAPKGGSSKEQEELSMGSRLLAALPSLPSFKNEAPLVAAIIENHEDARPHQVGLPNAEVVFEMIAEGDITRFLALFRGDDLPKSIGPVRSLRLHFVTVLDPYIPLLLHIGGNPLAYDALALTNRIIDHDGIRFDGQTYQRAKDIPAPHNLFMAKKPLLALLEEKAAKLTPVSFPLFATGGIPKGGKTAEKISVNFGSAVHDVTYTFNSWNGEYIRGTGGATRQATPENVLVLETEVQGYGERGAIPWTRTTGEGKMLLFRDGKGYEGRWKRAEGKPFSFVNAKGEELNLDAGQAWIMMLPDLRMVEWE